MSNQKKAPQQNIPLIYAFQRAVTQRVGRNRPLYGSQISISQRVPAIIKFVDIFIHINIHIQGGQTDENKKI
jgi:hypothetical protein